MTEPMKTISERLLERARLGELTEEELAALVARLEREEGGTERLDALIAADAEFLERHPAAEMAPVIRDKLRRRARERERSATSSGELMLSISEMFQSSQTRAIAAIAVVAVMAVAAAVLLDAGGGEEPTDRVTPPVAGLDSPGEDEASMPEEEELREERELPEEEDSEEVANFVPFLERIDRGTTKTGEVVLEPGEELTFDSRHIRRVEVDRTTVASVPTVSEELGTITIRAGEPGLTGVRVFFVEPYEPTTIYFRVARPYAEGETFPDGVLARAPKDELDACEEAARRRGDAVGMIDLRFLNASRGEVTSVHAEYSTLDAEFTECLVEAGPQYEFPATDERGMKTAVVSLKFEASAREPVDERSAANTPTQEDASPRPAAEAAWKAGLKATMRGDYRRAVELCEPIAEERPQCARVLAVAYKGLGEREEACRWHRKAGVDVPTELGCD